MITFEFKRKLEIDENYQVINLSEFTIRRDELSSNDLIIDNFIRASQLSFESLRNCMKEEPEKFFLLHVFDFNKINITNFKKTDKQGVSKFLFDFLNEPDWGDDRNDFAKLLEKYIEIHTKFIENDFYIISKD